MEVDATGIGKFFVKRTSAVFASQIEKLTKKLHKKKTPLPTAFAAHAVVLAARGREGRLMVFVGDPMITLPKSRPLTESREQVEDSKLLDRISKQTASVVFADGNAAWEAACLDRGLEHRPVTHQLKIFAAPCQTPGDLCNMAGTQCIDRTWLSLKGFLSQMLLLKDKSMHFNEEAKKHVRMYAFRANLVALHGPDVFRPKRFLAQLKEIV